MKERGLNTFEGFEWTFHLKLHLEHTAEVACWKFLLDFHFVSSIKNIHKSGITRHGLETTRDFLNILQRYENHARPTTKMFLWMIWMTKPNQPNQTNKTQKKPRYITLWSNHLCFKNLNNQEGEKQHMLVDKLLKTTQNISKIVSTQFLH